MIYKGKGGLRYELLPKTLAAGGEGEIYAIKGKPDIVAKIYKLGKASLEKEKKLIKMVAYPPDKSVLSQIAWAQDVLYENGNFVGFIMPKLEINEDLNVIYEYGASAKYPHMTWENRLIIAENLCAVLESVHAAGHICGDFNPKNISVNPNTGHIMFLDTDSYHIQDGSDMYRCDVGIPEYLPVEIQMKMRGGNTLASVNMPTFTKETDNFALAIHIFQLLMNGVHPFACAIIPSQSSVTAPQPSDNIIKGEFPFMVNIPGIKIPTYAPKIEILPKTIQEFFERAFVDGHLNPSVRPTAVDWHTALRELRNELKVCKNVFYHQYYKSLSSCPWCDVDNNFAQSFAPKSRLKQTTIKAPPIPTNGIVISRGIPSFTIAQKKKTITAVAIVAVIIIASIFLLRDSQNGNNNEGTPVAQSIDAELEASITAYQNGLQALANRNYSQAISELRKVITRDENFENAQDSLEEAISAYKSDIIGSLEVLEANKSFREIITRLNTALELIPADNDLLSKLTYYTGLMYEQDKEFVLGRIKEITEEASETDDFNRGLMSLSTLLRDYPAFGMEIESEANKLTDLLVNSNIEAIKDDVGEDGNYDNAITRLKSLKADYPSSFDAVINDLISQYTASLAASVTVVFDNDSIMLESGGSSLLSFRTTPENIVNLSYIWDSSDASVVSVYNGRVTARGFGVSEIRLKSSSGVVLATCQVSVNAYLGKDIFATEIDMFAWEFPASGLFEMAGVSYNKGIGLDSCNLFGWNKIVYKLQEKYNYLSGIYGASSENDAYDLGILIYGDGRLLARLDSTRDMFPKSFSINITGVDELRVEGTGGLSTGKSQHFLANVVVSTVKVDVKPSLPNYISKDNLILGQDIIAYRKRSGYWEFEDRSTILEHPLNGAIQMVGATYSNGLSSVVRGHYPGGIMSGGYAHYNLGGAYKKITGVYGPLFSTEIGRCKISFVGDGHGLGEYITIAGNEPIRFSIDVTNVHDLIIQILPDYSNNKEQYFAIADVVITK